MAGSSLGAYPADPRGGWQKDVQTPRGDWGRRIPDAWATRLPECATISTRLGWSHGDDEFFSDAQALEWFDLDGIGKSPARFDLKKLENSVGQHIAADDDAALQAEIDAFLAQAAVMP